MVNRKQETIPIHRPPAAYGKKSDFLSFSKGAEQKIGMKAITTSSLSRILTGNPKHHAERLFECVYKRHAAVIDLKK